MGNIQGIAQAAVEPADMYRSAWPTDCVIAHGPESAT